MIHVLMLAEVGAPLLAALFLRINGLVMLFMVTMFLFHEATALWDVRYAVSRRRVGPWEQHVHSFLELTPLMGLMLITVIHWDDLRSLMSWPPPPEAFSLNAKSPPLPAAYVIVLITAVLLLSVLPYMNEVWRGFKSRRRASQNLML